MQLVLGVRTDGPDELLRRGVVPVGAEFLVLDAERVDGQAAVVHRTHETERDRRRCQTTTTTTTTTNQQQINNKSTTKKGQLVDFDLH